MGYWSRTIVSTLFLTPWNLMKINIKKQYSSELQMFVIRCVHRWWKVLSRILTTAYTSLWRLTALTLSSFSKSQIFLPFKQQTKSAQKSNLVILSFKFSDKQTDEKSKTKSFGLEFYSRHFAENCKFGWWKFLFHPSQKIFFLTAFMLSNLIDFRMLFIYYAISKTTQISDKVKLSAITLQ